MTVDVCALGCELRVYTGYAIAAFACAFVLALMWCGRARKPEPALPVCGFACLYKTAPCCAECTRWIEHHK